MSILETIAHLEALKSKAFELSCELQRELGRAERLLNRPRPWIVFSNPETVLDQGEDFSARAHAERVRKKQEFIKLWGQSN